MPLAAQAFQGTGQIGLAQQGQLCGDLAAVEKDSRAFRIVAQGRQSPAGPFPVDPVDTDAAAGQANGRGQRVAQRQAAKAPGQLDQSGGQAGNRGGQRAIERQLFLYFAVDLVEIGMGRQRRAFAGVDKAVAGRLAVLAQQKETTAAQPGAVLAIRPPMIKNLAGRFSRLLHLSHLAFETTARS